MGGAPCAVDVKDNKIVRVRSVDSPKCGVPEWKIKALAREEEDLKTEMEGATPPGP
jgi:hypothetical protein